jgi:hypothetical protein
MNAYGSSATYVLKKYKRPIFCLFSAAMICFLVRRCVQHARSALLRRGCHTQPIKRFYCVPYRKYLVFGIPKLIVQQRSYVVHWEKEELPGTSKDPVIVSYNEKLRDFIDCEDFQSAQALLDEMSAKNIMGDIQTYALTVELIRKHYKRYIAEGNLWPPNRVFDRPPPFEIGMWNTALRAIISQEDTTKNAEMLLQKMREEKAKPNTETLNLLCEIFGEERGKQIVDELLKNAEG